MVFFLGFLDAILRCFVLKDDSKVLGIKFALNGKVKGKTRCSSVKISRGRLNFTASEGDVRYSKTFIHTKYGVFGLHMWVNFEVLKQKTHLIKKKKNVSTLKRKNSSKRAQRKRF